MDYFYTVALAQYNYQRIKIVRNYELIKGKLRPEDFYAEGPVMSFVDELIRDAVSINPPPMHRGRRLKILFMTQADVKPPKFIVFVNDPELMHFSYLRFLENRLREMYGFEGTPIRMIVRARDEEDDR